MPMIDISEFVTLKDIPLLETGQDYPGSNGYFTFTASMMEEAVMSQEDPMVISPRIKIAHIDNPILSDLDALWEQMNASRNDASLPALGTVQNMYAGNNGQTLYGDCFGLPHWLAAILETAYPARSVEGGQWSNPANQKEYNFTIDALAFLGVVGPGCTSLADLQVLFSSEGPKIEVIEMQAPKPKMGGRKVPSALLQVNVEDIRRSFYENFATPESGRYYWWDRELLIDPDEMIVQDPDEGQLYRVGIELDSSQDGVDAVSFGEPEPVKVKYVPDPSKTNSVEMARLIGPQLVTAGQVLAVNNQGPPREHERQNRKEDRMGNVNMSVDVSALRAGLGLTADQLPDDATEDQINAAITAKAAPAEPTAEEAAASAAAAEAEAATAAAAAAEADAAAASQEEAPAGTTTIDAGALALLQSQAQMGVAARTTQLEQERDAILSTAVAKGKFPPASVAGWKAQLSQGGAIEAQTRKTIAELPDNTVPVMETGTSEANEDTAAGAAYDPNWLSPGERARIAAAGTGEMSSRIIQEVS